MFYSRCRIHSNFSAFFKKDVPQIILDGLKRSHVTKGLVISKAMLRGLKKEQSLPAQKKLILRRPWSWQTSAPIQTICALARQGARANVWLKGGDLEGKSSQLLG